MEETYRLQQTGPQIEALLEKLANMEPATVQDINDLFG